MFLFRFAFHTPLPIAFPLPYSTAVACTLLLGRLIKSSIWSCARGCSSACPLSSVCGCSCICDNKNTCWQPPPVIAVAPPPPSAFSSMYVGVYWGRGCQVCGLFTNEFLVPFKPFAHFRLWPSPFRCCLAVNISWLCLCSSRCCSERAY